MLQSFWNLTGNLWALALSTVIALYLPEFGPDESMRGGVGVVIRTTILAPIVFSVLYLGGRLVSNLTGRLARNLKGRLQRGLMNVISAGIEHGLRDAMNHHAKKMAKEAAAAAAARAKEEQEQYREAVIQFLRSKGIPDEEFDAFIAQLTQQT